MNRIQELFQHKEGNILSVFFTAGFPKLEDTTEIIQSLAANGVDMIEIGMPYSDPIADGETIQASNTRALNNGISINKLFAQLAEIRQSVDIPLVLMGYVNPVMQYGMENFLDKAAEVGIDGLILPDLPMHEYQSFYKADFESRNLSNIFLITPQTAESRIRLIDESTDGFIYIVSTDSTTGKTSGFGDKTKAYFQRLQAMNLKNPGLIGFGISDHETFSTACNYAQGAIIGSAFIKAIDQAGSIDERVKAFVNKIKAPAVSG
ncbi:MAG: tryptophan synthase subunit alpha [Bacteroidota bacterium]